MPSVRIRVAPSGPTSTIRYVLTYYRVFKATDTKNLVSNQKMFTKYIQTELRSSCTDIILTDCLQELN